LSTPVFKNLALGAVGSGYLDASFVVGVLTASCYLTSAILAFSSTFFGIGYSFNLKNSVKSDAASSAKLFSKSGDIISKK
jgi:hypothetical protein